MDSKDVPDFCSVCITPITFCYWCSFFSSVRDRVRTKMERDILVEVNHPFIVKLHYGWYFASIFSLLEVVLATLSSKAEKRTCVCVCEYVLWFNPVNCLKNKKKTPKL